MIDWNMAKKIEWFPPFIVIAGVIILVMEAKTSTVIGWLFVLVMWEFNLLWNVRRIRKNSPS